MERLTKELIGSEISIKTHFATGGEEIADAISHLAAAFDQSTGRRVDKARTRARSYPCVAGALDPSLPVAKKLDGDLPELPKVLDNSLEKAVFTHQGFARGKNHLTTTEEMSYDRLEILGDAYIEVIATRLIWHHFRFLSPGRISQLRELLVKNETLAEYATRYGFDRRLYVPHDHREQPKRWVKIKGDVFEAYVAAVILSDPVNGFQCVETWLDELWLPKLTEAQPDIRPSFPKQDLAKKIMGKGIKIEYVEEKPSVSLSGGLNNFFVGVYLTGWGWSNQHLGSGEGHSKTDAGNGAALQALANKSLINKIVSVKKSNKNNAM